MSIEQLKTLYNLSQDYSLLEKLMREGNEIPCFVTYNWNHDPKDIIMATDIASARFIAGKCSSRYDNLHVGCRGSSFIDAYPNDEWESEHHIFKDLCKRFDLWFILPNKNKK